MKSDAGGIAEEGITRDMPSLCCVRSLKIEIEIYNPNAEAIEGATEPCRVRVGDATTDGVMEPCLTEGAMDGATDPCRWRSHNLSFARTSMFSNGAGCSSLTQSRVPRTSNSKKNDEAARRDAFKIKPLVH